MAQQNIPYEYHTQFGPADEKERMAQLLTQLAARQQPGAGQMVGNIFVRANPLQHLASVLSQWQAGMLGRQAQQARADVYRRMAADEAAEKARIAELTTGRMPQTAPGDYGPGEAPTVGPQTSVSADPVQASRLALASSFPNIQKFGEQLRQQLSSQFSAMAPHATPESIMASGGNPMKLAPKPPEKWGDITNVASPGATNPIYASREQTTGKFSFAPQPGAQQNVTIGDKAGIRILEQKHQQLFDPKTLEKVEAAKRTLDSGSAALNLLQTVPLNLGVDSTVKTFAQKLARVVGKEPDPRASATELYQSFVIPQIANIIKMFGAGTGISDQDRKAAEQALAMATREPQMIKVALAYALRGSYKELQAYENSLLRAKQAAAGMGVDPGLFEGDLRYGFTVPPGMEFPDNFLEPGVLEEWATKELTKKPASSSDLPITLTPDQEAAIRKYLPRRQ